MRISAAIRNSYWPLVVEASVSVLLKKLGFESIFEPGLDALPVLVCAVDLQALLAVVLYVLHVLQLLHVLHPTKPPLPSLKIFIAHARSLSGFDRSEK